MLSIGPGPVQGDHRRQVVDRGRPQLADVAPHARPTRAGRRRSSRPRPAARTSSRRRAGSARGRSRSPRCGLDEVDRLAQDRQVREAQEVELEQAQRLDAVHLVLGHQRVGVGRLLERHQLGQRLAADDHAGGVGRGVAGDALELLGELDAARSTGGSASTISRRSGDDLERLVEPDAELVRDGLGDAVDLAVAHAQDAADVADGRPGEHRAEGDDLGDVVRAVLAA